MYVRVCEVQLPCDSPFNVDGFIRHLCTVIESNANAQASVYFRSTNSKKKIKIAKIPTDLVCQFSLGVIVLQKKREKRKHFFLDLLYYVE